MTPEAVVARVFGQDPGVVADATSPESLGEWDSLGHIMLVIELESVFGTSFAPDETIAMTSVRAIKNTLRAHGIRW